MRGLGVVVLAAAWAMAFGMQLRAEVQEALLKGRRPKNTPPPAASTQDLCANNVNGNDNICYQILQTEWWKNRKALPTDILANAQTMDTVCAKWSANHDECNLPSKRTGVLTAQEQGAPCVQIGGHSKTCVGNPCNNLNNGECQLASSMGYCVWWELSDIKQINAYRKKLSPQEFDLTSGFVPTTHGCYRNPCNIAGTGKQSQDTCGPRSVPGLFQCTYCKGANDLCGLENQGMGCQMTQLEWKRTNQCAPVNNPAVNKASIVQIASKKSCQCSTETPLCQTTFEQDQQQKSPQYKNRF